MAMLIVFMSIVTDAEPIQLVNALSTLNRCGPLALQACALAVEICLTQEEIEEVIPANGEESSLAQLQAAAAQLGLETLAVRWSGAPPESEFGDTAAIIPIVDGQGRHHFVAMLSVQGDHVLIVDVPNQPFWLRFNDLRDRLQWKGYALHVARNRSSMEELEMQLNHSRLWGINALWIVGIILVALSAHSWWRKQSHRSQICPRES